MPAFRLDSRYSFTSIASFVPLPSSAPPSVLFGSLSSYGEGTPSLICSRLVTLLISGRACCNSYASCPLKTTPSSNPIIPHCLLVPNKGTLSGTPWMLFKQASNHIHNEHRLVLALCNQCGLSSLVTMFNPVKNIPKDTRRPPTANTDSSRSPLLIAVMSILAGRRCLIKHAS